MQAIALLLLLAGGNIALAGPSATSGNDGGAQAPMLQEWLESVTGLGPPTELSTRAAAGRMDASHHGSRLDKDLMCLQASLDTRCSLDDGWVVRSKVGCCKAEHQERYGGDSTSTGPLFDPMLMSVGACTWTSGYDIDEDGVELSLNTDALGASTIQCTLTSAAEECGPVGCGDLTLTAQVETYRLWAALLEGDVAGAFTLDTTVPDTDCNLSLKREASPDMPRLKDSLLRLARNKTERQQNRQDATISVASGVYYASGPVTISSRTHKTKWEAGWVTFMVPVEIYPASPAELQDLESDYGPLPKVSAKDFGKFKFEFFRQEERY